MVAHLIGDFLLQPTSWVIEKEARKGKSISVYLHFLIHGALALLFLWDFNLWPVAASITISHAVIDLLKIYSQKSKTATRWFFLDQFLHLSSILLIWSIFFGENINFRKFINSQNIWIYAAGILFVTQVSAIFLQVILKNWADELNLSKKYSLKKAGKYIGILERLFVFTFVLLGRWEAIGFLITAKSVFRFSDLRRSKDRKLTEYILVGTLFSFGLAIATGLMTQWLLKY
jgi:hypothetical protein